MASILCCFFDLPLPSFHSVSSELIVFAVYVLSLFLCYCTTTVFSLGSSARVFILFSYFVSLTWKTYAWVKG
jgi:hypothetical protein